MNERNAQILNRVKAMLEEGDVVSCDLSCDEIEIEPKDGYRQFKAGPHVIFNLVVKRRNNG